MKTIKIKKMDSVFSKLVRGRVDYRCEKCGTYYPHGERQGIHCSHLWGRARQSTRFHPMNAFCHCLGCHQFFTANPVLFHRWALVQLGGRNFVDLEVEANRTLKRSRAQKEDLYEEMKSQLKHMESLRAQGETGRIEFVL